MSIPLDIPLEQIVGYLDVEPLYAITVSPQTLERARQLASVGSCPARWFLMDGRIVSNAEGFRWFAELDQKLRAALLRGR